MRRKRIIKRIVGGISIVVLLMVINFIPTWNLKANSMEVFEGEWVNVYYEKEGQAARDVFELADSRSKELAELLGFKEKTSINIYIYDRQQTMQTKKYGWIAPLLGLDWYIGDNIGTDVILTSPAQPGNAHSYESVKTAVLHEMVHAYVTLINPHPRLWLTEGMALYLSNGMPFESAYLEWCGIPTYEEIKTNNPIKFQKIGGYDLAHTYIEYLVKEYGLDQVVEVIRTEDYEGIFGKSEQDIYREWIEFIKNYGG